MKNDGPKGMTRFFDEPIITDPEDTDQYKLVMKAAFHRWYPEIPAEYIFTCRTPGVDFRPLLPYIQAQINLCGNLRYSRAALDYIGSMQHPRFSPAFIRFLESEKWYPEDVSTECDAKGTLHVRVSGPSVVYGTDWEIYILAIVSELHFNYQLMLTGQTKEAIFDDAMWRQRENLAKLLNLREKEFDEGEECDFTFTEFGTRRRMCKEWQRRVLEFWNEKLSKRFCWGTSNIYFARTMGLKIVGTHGHEWDSAHLALTNPLLAKIMAMDRWLDTFGGDAGITLTDTFTTKHFLTVFDKKYANAYIGVRHDSGPWREWAEKMLSHYEKLGIDPKTKILLFSDGLDFDAMIEIYLALHKRCIVRFGCGTKITNDCLIKALQIVIKLVLFDGFPVLKSSDDIGKLMCLDKDVAGYMMKLFNR